MLKIYITRILASHLLTKSSVEIGQSPSGCTSSRVTAACEVVRLFLASNISHARSMHAALFRTEGKFRMPYGLREGGQVGAQDYVSRPD
jgi:hypothetical protein